MRADRLISILLLLQNRGKMTTKELAKELEVSERTVHRDMNALSATGIPIVSERGKNGGWRLIEQYRSNLTGLKENEIKALFVSPSTYLLADLGLAKNAEKARQKLLASLPPIFRKNAKAIWERIHIDSSTWRQSTEKIDTLKILQQAIWEQQKLEIIYERADGKCIESTVEPLGLVAKGSTWYLIASVHGEFRNYRASRIKSARIIAQTFTRPANFDLAQYWQASNKEFLNCLPKYEVHVEISPTIIQRIKFTGRFVLSVSLILHSPVLVQY